jgi:short-subunit dehydrogenase
MALIATNNSYALVTGGSSGIGLAFVHQLASKGYNLFIVSNQEDELEVLKKQLVSRYKVKCHTLYMDLAQKDAALEVYNHCKELGLEIEVLINNAGFLIADKVIDVDPGKVNALLNLHVCTTTMMCRYFAKDMVDKGKGYILNTSSTSAFMPYPTISLYGPSKTYIRNFTRALRNELYNENIHVSCIMPGAVDTNLYDISSSQIKLAKVLGVMHSPEFIAKQGMRLLSRNRSSSVPGFVNKLTIVSIKFVPDFIIRAIFRARYRKLAAKEKKG